METRYRQKLNNYLQARHREDPKKYLNYEKWSEGTDRQPTWHVIANLYGDQWGHGIGTNLSLATEAAAKQVLIALKVPLEDSDEAEGSTHVTA